MEVVCEMWLGLPSKRKARGVGGERGPRIGPDVVPHWKLSRGEMDLATESLNERLGRILKPFNVREGQKR